METTRRDLVKLASFGLVAFPLAGNAAPTPAVDVAALCADLAAQRSRIKSLRVIVRATADHPPATRELFFDGTNYHLRITQNGSTMFCIATPSRTVTVGSTRARVTPTKHWPPGLSLVTFLPIPLQQFPVSLDGTEWHGGATYARLVQGSKRMTIALDRPHAVVKQETIDRKGGVRRREEFSSFTELQDGVFFPHVMQHHAYDKHGTLRVAGTTTVDEVELNQPVDPELFDLTRYLPRSRRER